MTAPSLDEIAGYLARARLPEADRETLADHREAIAAQDEIVTELDELPEAPALTRDSVPPDEAADPHGAFLRRCDITGADEGVLAGATVAVKDNIAVGGVPMTCGSPFMEGYVPPQDATVVSRLLAAGGRLVGKANMDEFALGGDTDAMRFRLARNPADPAHQPGGSSAGSGVAVADGLVDLALGSDTGGSVRFPASFCGVVGVKPTRGLVPDDGFVQFARQLDTIGVLAGDTATAARGLGAIATGPDDAFLAAVDDPPAPTELTIGRPAALWDTDDAVDTVVEAALDRLADAGATVVDVSIPNFEFAVPAWLATAMTELAAYFGAMGVNYWAPSKPDPAFVTALAERFAEQADELGPYIRSSIVYGRHLIDGHENDYYARAQRGRQLVTDGVDETLSAVDVLASPTTPILPPEWGDGYLDDLSIFEVVGNTGPFNLTGHPAVSVPCGRHEGLPIGLQFVADDDATALAAAATWEALAPEVGP